MNWDTYKIINKLEFEATGLVSREVTLPLQGIGQKTFLVTKGNTFSVTVDGVMLSCDVTGENPFQFENRLLYIDANSDVFYGVPST